ncbi:MAG TPA: glycosyltransferase family 39 protein [Thermoanaerobaculia bacterium]
MSRSERLALAACAIASLVLRSIAFFHYRFDSDEPQHLHVAWGWTAGLVQYRDYFDNHAPLFHILSAPLLAILGERSTILFYMRAAMLPLFLIVIFCTYLLAKRLYSERIALWSAVLLSLFPPFFLKSLEYRTDNLWTALWMVALVVLISRPPAAPRWFIAGLILGTAMTVSMKTTLLLITLAGAGVITRWVIGDKTRFVVPAIAAACGFVIMPAIVAGYFIAAGASPRLVYCVFTFNAALERVRPHITIERFLWPFAIAAIVFLARRYRHSEMRRMFCAVALAVFCVTLLAFWILISPRDMLPIMPIGAMFLVAAFERFDDRVFTCSITAVVFIVSLFYYANRFQNHTEQFVTMMNQVLRLTRPGEPLMDIKGETIYRPRPFYYIFELITRSEIDNGFIRDTVPEAVVAARCHVAQADGTMFPPRGRAFLNANFMDLGRLRASGQWIQPDGTFSIAVPGPYVAVNERGEASGSLDGSTYPGARELAAGTHRFVRAENERIAVIWARAFERGFSPFHLQDRNFRYRARHSHSKQYR